MTTFACRFDFQYSRSLTHANASYAIFNHGLIIMLLSFTYTLLRICSTPTFPIFNLSGFERELLKLHEEMIPYFVALDVGSKICQVQQYSSIRGCHTTFLLKSTLFKGEVAWQPLTERQGCSLCILEPHIRAFK